MYKYTGPYEGVFSQYKDVSTGHTLVAQPDQSYDIRPAVEGIPEVPPGFELEEVVTPEPVNHESDGE